MRVLRVGVTGPDVLAWETFLRGLYPDCQLVVDSVFDDETKKETAKFQSDVGLSGLNVDGVVGNMTYAKAALMGFKIADDSPGIIDENGPDWPPLPNGVFPLSSDDKKKLFGDFAYVPAPTDSNPEGIKITDDWAQKNIVYVPVPQLARVSGAPQHVPLHRLVSDQGLGMFK